MSRQPTPNVLDMVLGPASAELSPLTTWESGRLAHLEGVIEAGLQTFYDVGGALMEIREGRLYRQTHRSFEAYTKERWGMGKSRAHQLIEAAKTPMSLPSALMTGCSRRTTGRLVNWQMKGELTAGSPRMSC